MASTSTSRICSSLIDRWADEIATGFDDVAGGRSEVTSEASLRAWAASIGAGDDDVAAALAHCLGARLYRTLQDATPAMKFVSRIPIQMARRHGVIALAESNGVLPCVVSGINGLLFADVVGRLLQLPTSIGVASPATVSTAINRAYEQQSGQADVLIESLEESPEMSAVRKMAQREDLLDVSGRAPVIQLVNMLLFDAVKAAASDVHIQPYEDRLVVRFRIDGILFDQFTIPKSTQEEIVSRVKVLGKMNIAEKRLPQDGRASVQVGDRQIELRLSAIPTSFGERVVIRLLDKTGRLLTLEELGMPDKCLSAFRHLIQREHGLILVTGPTGAGKSTTLYAALQQINSKDRNILTIEDPIEYQLDGISQTQVSTKKGLTFARGLRSVLRQDPDIIMVGEIRDRETAEMAIQSALTGHLVFSTLHTNDAASAVTRLLDLGIEPYLVASSLMGVLAQRLVRRNCVDCRREVHVPPAAWQKLLGDLNHAQTTYAGQGCPSCRGTGYRGRIGLFELMVCSERVRALIQRGQDASSIRKAAVQSGMRLLRQDGIDKIAVGETTIEEVLRVAGGED